MLSRQRRKARKNDEEVSRKFPFGDEEWAGWCRGTRALATAGLVLCACIYRACQKELKPQAREIEGGEKGLSLTSAVFVHVFVLLFVFVSGRESRRSFETRAHGVLRGGKGRLLSPHKHLNNTLAYRTPDMDRLPLLLLLFPRYMFDVLLSLDTCYQWIPCHRPLLLNQRER